MFKEIGPEPFEPILAEISRVFDLGESRWFEVIHHDGENWCCYSGGEYKESDTILRWKHVDDCWRY